MMTVDQAIEAIVGAVHPLPAESVSLQEARGRVLAEEVTAPRDLPPVANSAMDGYAFCRGDVAGAPEGARRLHLAGFVAAGQEGLPLRRGEAVKIMTGAPIPPGADTVVPVEDATEAGEEVEIRALPALGAHVRPAGEDVREGEPVLTSGRRLRPAEVALLAGLGRSYVLVRGRPSAAIVSSGDELVEVGRPVGAAQLYDANSHGLAAQVEEAGGLPLPLGIARDDPELLREVLGRAASADVLVTSGGISLGDRDFLEGALAGWGVRFLVRKAAIRPGKPFLFGLRGDMPVFALPGNPVAAMLGFEVFVRPALLLLQGRERPHRPVLDATLAGEAGAVVSKGGRREFLRCRVETGSCGLRVVRVMRQGAALLKTLADANAFLVVPEAGARYEPGDVVRVQPYDLEFLDEREPFAPGAEDLQEAPRRLPAEEARCAALPPL